MKKTIAILLVLCLGIGLCACGEKNNTSADVTQSSECAHDWNVTDHFIVCKHCGKDAEIVEIEAKYIGSGNPQYGVDKDEVEVIATYENGTEKKLSSLSYKVIGDEYGMPGETCTYTVEHEESKCKVDFPVTFAEIRYFEKSRDEFCDAFFAAIKTAGITNLQMELKSEDDIITQASFKDSSGRYLFFLYFENTSYEYENNIKDPYCHLKLEANKSAPYKSDDMTKMKIALVSVTLPSSDFSTADVMQVLSIDEEWEVPNAGIYYMMYKSSNIDYMRVELIQGTPKAE